jgi:plasmid stability protein
MPEMLIRDIPEDHYRRLQGLAERHGISLEEYVRGLIIDAVRDHDRRNAGEVLEEIRRMYPGVGFEEGEIKELREVLRGSIEPVDFSDH